MQNQRNDARQFESTEGNSDVGPFSPVAEHDFVDMTAMTVNEIRPPSRHSRWIEALESRNPGNTFLRSTLGFSDSELDPVIIEPVEDDTSSSFPEADAEHLYHQEAIMSTIREAMNNVRRSMRRLQIQHLARQSISRHHRRDGPRLTVQAVEEDDSPLGISNRNWRIYNGRLSINGELPDNMDVSTGQASIQQRWRHLETEYRHFLLNRQPSRFTDLQNNVPHPIITNVSGHSAVFDDFPRVNTDQPGPRPLEERRASLDRILNQDEDFWKEIDGLLETSSDMDANHMDHNNAISSQPADSLFDLIMQRVLDPNGCATSKVSMSIGKVFLDKFDYEFVGR